MALSVDGKTYYLNHSCVASFSDHWRDKSEFEQGGGGGRREKTKRLRKGRKVERGIGENSAFV